MKFQSNSIFNGKITANSVADAGTNTDKFLVLSSNGDVSYRTAAELYIDLGIGSLPAGYTSTLKHQVKAGVALTKGQAVYVTSADGTNMIVGKASNDSESTSSKTFGLIETSLSNNGIGNVITEGLLAGLDTTGANAAGDPVWLGTNGNLIYGLLNKPFAPAHLVFIGIVTRVNANNGEIFVKVQNGFEMGELHNYAESGVQNNDIITWENSTSLYKPKSIATILGYTPANAATYVPYTGATASVLLGTNVLYSGGVQVTNSGTGVIYTDGWLQAGKGIFLADTVSGGQWQSGLTNIVARNSGLLITHNSGGGILAFNTSNTYNYTFPAANGTVALTADIPTLSGLGGVPTSRTLTINGTAYDLSADRSWTISANINARTEYEFTTDGSSATYSATYTVGQVDVFYNGSKLASTEFTATNGTSVVLGFTPPSGQVVEVVAWETGGGVSNGRTLTINGVSYDLSADRSWTISAGISGSGTSNYLPKWSSSTGLGDSNIYDNGNYLGIKTTNPLADLHVYNGSAAASILLQTNSSTDYGEIAVRNAGAAATSYFRQYSSSVGGTLFGVSNNNLACFFSNYASNFAIGTLNGGDLILATANTERVRILNSNGYVGIGTSSPSYLLDVNSATDTYGQYRTSAADADVLLGFSNTGDGNNGWGIGRRNTGEFWIANYIGNFLGGTRTVPFQLATSGAATFTAGVTAAGLNSTIAKSGTGVESINLLNLRATGTGAFDDKLNIRFLNTDGINIANISGILGGDNIAYGTLAFSIRSYNTDAMYEAMRINNRGNIGIGTISPVSLSNQTSLTINGTAVGRLDLSAGGSSNTAGMYATSSGGTVFSFGDLPFLTGASTTEKMRITGAGLIGIGTSSPTETFTLAGSARITGQATDFSAGTRGINIDVISSIGAGRIYMVNGTGTAGDLLLGTANTERMRITAAGEVLVGMTGVTTTSTGSMISQGGSYANVRLFGTGSQTFVQFFLSGTAMGSITGSGSTTSYNTSSDYRLKQDLKDYNGLDIVNSIKTYDYEWKSNNTRAYGVLAHELAEIIPYAVTGEKDGLDADGKIAPQGVDYSKLVPVLIKAIQEQQAQIEELKARLN